MLSFYNRLVGYLYLILKKNKQKTPKHDYTLQSLTTAWITK